MSTMLAKSCAKLSFMVALLARMPVTLANMPAPLAHPPSDPDAFLAWHRERLGLSGRHLSAKRYDYYRCNGYISGCRNTLPAASIHALEPQIRQAVADFEHTPPTPSGEAEAQLERLQDEEQRWLEAYRARVITLSQLAGYKSEIERARSELVVKSRVPVTSATVRQAAHTMALRQLLQLASVQIVATREAITVQVFA
jgi:hypothetical protein